jgi:hypothetical protein
MLKKFQSNNFLKKSENKIQDWSKCYGLTHQTDNLGYGLKWVYLFFY